MTIATSPSSPSDVRPAEAVRSSVDNVAVSPPVLALSGDVDAANSELLLDAVSAFIESSAGDVVIDLTEVEFIDIASVRILDVARLLLSREGRLLTFRSPSRLVALVLGLFGLARFTEASESALR